MTIMYTTGQVALGAGETRLPDVGEGLFMLWAHGDNSAAVYVADVRYGDSAANGVPLTPGLSPYVLTAMSLSEFSVFSGAVGNILCWARR